VSLEKLNGTLVLFGTRARREGAEIPAASSLRVLFSRIEPVLSAPEADNHADFSLCARDACIRRERRLAALFA
jgi:hypothetical protein